MWRAACTTVAFGLAVGLAPIAWPGLSASNGGGTCASRGPARGTRSIGAPWPTTVLTPEQVLTDRLRGAGVTGSRLTRMAGRGTLALVDAHRGGLQLHIATVAPGVMSVRLAAPSRVGSDALRLALSVAPGEHFYGLGERFFGPDLAGHRLDTWTEDRDADPSKPTSYYTTPFLLSSSGYGLYLDTSARSSFDIGASDPGCLLITVQTASLHAYLIVGQSPKIVLERRARLVGRPPLPPAWGFGVWKTLIGGPASVEAETKRLRTAGIPVDAAWIYDAVDPNSGFGWPWKLYGPTNPGTYPDLHALVCRLHRDGLKVLGYLNPFLYRGTSAFAIAARHHYLVVDASGQPIIQPWQHHAYIDFTSRAASAWWEARIRSALRTGFDGAMQDFGEDAPTNGVYANGEPGRLVHNRYPVLYSRAVRRAAQQAKPNDTVFFARAGYSGTERYVTGGFTGDQQRSWSPSVGIGSVVPAILSAGLSGRPYWGPDIAGFFQGDTGPDQQQLWERWLELGALTPTMRDMLGSFNHPIDLWGSADTTRLFRRYARLHETLKPYIYRYARIAHQTGLPIMRPLFLNYPGDAQTYALSDEYLLGDDLLVAPVTRAGETRRHLYLPAGRWQNHWTSRTYTGPGWITVAAPPDQIPLLIHIHDAVRRRPTDHRPHVRTPA